MSVLPGRKSRALQAYFQVNEEPALQGDISQNACSVAKTNLGSIDTRSELERRLPEVFPAVHLRTRDNQLLSRCGLPIYQTRSCRGRALGALLQTRTEGSRIPGMDVIEICHRQAIRRRQIYRIAERLEQQVSVLECFEFRPPSAGYPASAVVRSSAVTVPVRQMFAKCLSWRIELMRPPMPRADNILFSPISRLDFSAA